MSEQPDVRDDYPSRATLSGIVFPPNAAKYPGPGLQHNRTVSKLDEALGLMNKEAEEQNRVIALQTECIEGLADLTYGGLARKGAAAWLSITFWTVFIFTIALRVVTGALWADVLFIVALGAVIVAEYANAIRALRQRRAAHRKLAALGKKVRAARIEQP
ncbi:hypothetical protein ACMX2H_15915 [Arthrobacter sulfonylureivorans]|uniref:hypothetical protein n=1 Tax=Arthrobacter sulfonylureivorans TaxID=2486855 RepID=UPI0039E30AC6